MRRISIISVSFFCLVTFLTACQDPLYYAVSQDFPEQGWDSHDSVCFSIPAAEQDQEVTITFDVRTTSSFRYQDIVACVDLLDGDSLVSSTPLNMKLYTRQDDLEKGFLALENYSKPQPLHMQANHNYQLRVTHRMKLNPLAGVLSIGILVEH